MRKLIRYTLFILAAGLVLYACKKDDFELGPPPTAADAAFTFVPTTNPNIITFTSTSTAFLKKWDFGNGMNALGNSVVGKFALKGTYTVTLTVLTSGGSVSSSQTVEIANTDPTLLDIPIYNNLTGGKDSTNGKGWVIDKNTAGHFGVGPPADTIPSYYKAGVNEKDGAGMYDDVYRFKLTGFEFDQITNGDVFINAKQAVNFPGAVAASGDFKAPFTDLPGLTWTITPDPDNKHQMLTISPDGFIGYFTGTRVYKIMTLTKDKMVLRYLDAADEGLVWYLTLIPLGGGPSIPAPTIFPLPITFEGGTPANFNPFEGAAFAVVDNPSKTGIDVSDKVGQYIKGTQQNYAGMSVDLDAKIDFSTNALLKMKLYAPVAGDAKVKLESIDGTATAIEVDVNTTLVNTWEELTFDFSAAPSNTFNRITIFFDFQNNNGGTFYFDDIAQAAQLSSLTEADLTGGGSKIWTLKPAAGAFGVGPSRGSDAYYPNGPDISGARPCLFNDEYIFKTGGVYEYNSLGDIFGEDYMGYPDGQCRAESTLPVAAASWGSGTHTFTFTPATDVAPAYITVTGTGAFIALPKAHNGGEYLNAPPTTDASVKYEVLSYVKNGTSETLAIAVDISPAQDGTLFWSFILINKP